MVLAEQMQVKGTWEEICNNSQMEKEVLRIITEAAVSGRGFDAGDFLRCYRLSLGVIMSVLNENFTVTYNSALKLFTNQQNWSALKSPRKSA